ncbi:MAG TPA: carboxypeptidase regulatory-like domain-containing protein [Opitutaceae bacterium]|nr:carboxypeptidase regulatory-like domain-containing protein [Opitutaceae bacterium]HND61888.1 carboxypeptidase regulatory-like domain-containing protein [Opitutaceae bacterium]
MRRFLLLLLLSLVTALAVRAGSITGTVRGVPPKGGPETGGAGGAYENRRYKFAEKIDYDRLRDFVIYIDQAVPEAPHAPLHAAVTTQKDASFDPHVLPVPVGTTVRWPNEDEIFHNVYSTSDPKQFDLGFYKKEKVPELTFDQVGRVDVFCAIHTKMHCIILVVPNSYFAVADAHGHFTLPNLPPGKYRVRAWHERLPSQMQEVEVPAEGNVTVDFRLSLDALPKY